MSHLAYKWSAHQQIRTFITTSNAEEERRLTSIQYNASDGGHRSDDHDADVEDHQGPVEVQLPALGLAQEDVHGQGQYKVDGGDPQGPHKSCMTPCFIFSCFTLLVNGHGWPHEPYNINT